MTIVAYLLTSEDERVFPIPQHVDVLRESVLDPWYVRCMREGYGYTSSTTAVPYVEVRWHVLLRDETSAIYTRVLEAS